jgi:hypothetical protein
MPVARLSDLADVERARSTSGSGDGEACEPWSWLGDEECIANMNALCIPGNRLAPLNENQKKEERNLHMAWSAAWEAAVD